MPKCWPTKHSAELNCCCSHAQVLAHQHLCKNSTVSVAVLNGSYFILQSYFIFISIAILLLLFLHVFCIYFTFIITFTLLLLLLSRLHYFHNYHLFKFLTPVYFCPLKFIVLFFCLLCSSTNLLFIIPIHWHSYTNTLIDQMYISLSITHKLLNRLFVSF